jgi:peptidyl-prolyl cis-trans isomerase-like 4
MSVMVSTSCGSLVVDLFTRECPKACENFLKLCKAKYYHGCLFWSVETNFIAQTGDPTGTGKGGSSVWGLIGTGKVSFVNETHANRALDRVGLVCMTNTDGSNRSQFFITLRAEGFEHLRGKVTVLGEVAEGMPVLKALNELYCDADGRPFQDVRILHTDVLDDPYPDTPDLTRIIPPNSPVSADKQNPYVSKAEQVRRRIPFERDLNEVVMEHDKGHAADMKRKEASSRAMVLEMVGDLPDADVKPPDEILFVCKLNSITTDEDLELIFSRFGAIKDCSIVRDPSTGASMQYAFIEFAEEKSCLVAYEKMNNVLIDDRRIKVDFSQSVSQMWNKFRRRDSKSSNAKPATNKRVRNDSQSPDSNPHKR